MYKLLLVSDQEEVLNTFEQIQNWEYNGFRKPHIRFDAAGAKDSLSKHHADGLVMALSPEKEHELMVWLRKEYPLLLTRRLNPSGPSRNRWVSSLISLPAASLRKDCRVSAA